MKNRTTAVKAVVAALLLASMAACGMNGTSDPTPAQPAPTTKATSAASSRPVAGGKKPTGVIAAFGSAVPGTPDAIRELQDAKYAGFTELVNYSSMNGESAKKVSDYLNEARKLGIGVIFSVKDILGKKDTDTSNASLHRLYGATTDAQATTVAKQFLTNDAVTRVLISDEVPDGAKDRADWLQQLKKRSSQIKMFAPKKPIMVVLYWNKADTALYRSVKQYTDDLGIELFPLPRSAKNVPQSQISMVGRVVNQTASGNGWFVLQAFGWGSAETMHPEGVHLGYKNKLYAPPNAGQMVEMAKLAVDGGAKNLLFYQLSDPNPASLLEVKKAVATITSATWWK